MRNDEPLQLQQHVVQLLSVWGYLPGSAASTRLLASVPPSHYPCI